MPVLFCGSSPQWEVCYFLRRRHSFAGSPTPPNHSPAFAVSWLDMLKTVKSEEYDFLKPELDLLFGTGEDEDAKNSETMEIAMDSADVASEAMSKSKKTQELDRKASSFANKDLNVRRSSIGRVSTSKEEEN